MTLNHLNAKFLQSNPVPATPYGTALVRSIRESLLLDRPEPLTVGSELFEWLMEVTESTPTATTNGVEFVRVTGLNENFVDVINQPSGTKLK